MFLSYVILFVGRMSMSIVLTHTYGISNYFHASCPTKHLRYKLQFTLAHAP
jgi:hypothetical protein